ncbi:hypothetical protein SUGI_0587340 [Cryptomeria japonica]|nr:hypothetical protein SUGI_0587340 [Cryptomeria japonica]
MASSLGRIEVEKYKGSNFDMWKLKMEDLLIDRDLWDAVDANVQRPSDPTAAAQYDVMDRKAKGLIRLCLADSVLINVHEENSAKKLWTKLGEMYQVKSLLNKIFLRKKLYSLKMEEGGRIADHLEAFNMLVAQLVSVGVKMDEEEKCQILLCSLPNSWDSLVMAIGSTSIVLKSEDMVGALLGEEMRRKVSISSKEALTVRGRPKEKGKMNEKRDKSKSKGRSKSPGKSKVICWNCGKPGHIHKDCKEEKKKKKKKFDSDSESDKEDGDAFIAALATHAGNDAWLIDLGASFHMTSNRDWFLEYEGFNGGKVYLGDDSALEIFGRGKVRIRFSDGRIKRINGVLHIPRLKRNLLSVSKLIDVGVQVVFSEAGCKMITGAMVVARGVRFGTLYKLEAYTVECNSTSVKSKSANTSLEDLKVSPSADGNGFWVPKGALSSEAKLPAEKTMLWHQRPGHIGEKGLRTLKNKNLVEGLNDCNLDFDFCEHCIYGKKNRVQFYSSSHKTYGVLDLIHSHVFGPVDVSSIGKSTYYVSFIDDFSRRTWVYFLKSKSEFFSRFKEFKAMVELQTGKKIKCLRTDNGGEFFSNDFDRFYKDYGINRQKRTPYSPQQNGVTERMNRTLMEKARSMLSGAGLEQKFWAEAIATACYLINRSPTLSLVDKMPMEAWSGHKPSLRHLRVFGCEAYAHVPKEKRTKLENKAMKCIFIGYSYGVKGYKLWDLVAQKVIHSRSVIFREIKSPSVTLQPEQTKKEDVIQLPSTPERVESRPLDKQEVQESSSSSESSEEEEEPPTQLVQRSTRHRQPPERYSPNDWRCIFALNTSVDEPKSVEEALGMNDAESWKIAMEEEMAALKKNDTWDLVPLPEGRKPVGCKWVFKKKIGSDGSIEKYKARLVAKGYSQVEGVDYGEIFSPIAKMMSIRFLLSIATAYDLEVEQMDVKTTFLHGDLEEDIYMTQPEHYVVKGKINLVWKGMISELKSQLTAKFEMKDLGVAKYILGMEIRRDRVNRKLWLGQSKYVNSVLQRFNMQNCRPLSVPFTVGMKLSVLDCPTSPLEMEDMSRVPYQSAVGSLMYVMVCTRLDIAQAAGVLSRYMSNPGRVHWDAVKRVFRYLKGTSEYSLCYHGNSVADMASLDIHGYVDSDWAGDIDSRRSTSAYVFTLFGGAISWMSKRQAVVALSTTEVEYMVATHACKEAIWLKRLCLDIGIKQGTVTVYCDS